MKEMLSVFSRDGKYIGSRTRNFCHSENPGVYHKSVFIWFINSKGEVLVTKRNQNKKQYPGKWEMAVAGHVDDGETIVDTCLREIKEELGINVLKDEIQYLTEWIIDEEWELAQIYLVKKDVDLKDITLEEDELDDVKWLNYNDFLDLLYSDKFCEYKNKEYKKYIARVLKGEKL